MTDQPNKEAPSLKPRLLAALKECAEWHAHQPYVWKPGAMRSLAALGLVEPEELMYCGKVPYRITQEGRAFLEAMS